MAKSEIGRRRSLGDRHSDALTNGTGNSLAN
jgi:hypothetical protein